jgi:thioredoxin reductase (NADPH)
LGVPGEAEFAGRGMIESGARDRGEFAGQDVCVVGGGDAAVENALLLAEACATVTLVHRGKKLRARREFVERLQGTHCVTTFTESELVRVIGGEGVEAVEIRRRGALKPFQMAVKGVLVRVGYDPNTELFREQLELDERGYVLTNSEHETSAENVFAVGDVSNPRAPTIAGATGAGATAAKVIAARLDGAAK